MELNSSNISEWLKELDKKAEVYFGKNFSKTLTRKQWLEDCEEMTVDDVISENIYACL